MNTKIINHHVALPAAHAPRYKSQELLERLRINRLIALQRCNDLTMHISGCNNCNSAEVKLLLLNFFIKTLRVPNF